MVLSSRPFFSTQSTLTSIPWMQATSFTFVPLMPIVCVASSAPLVSVVTTSSVVIFVNGISSRTIDCGPSPLESGVNQPTDNVPISLNSIPGGLLYDQYLSTLQNLTYNPLGS